MFEKLKMKGKRTILLGSSATIVSVITAGLLFFDVQLSPEKIEALKMLVEGLLGLAFVFLRISKKGD